jgi:hypothetical protein
MENKSTLFGLLKEYLAGKTKVEYPELEVQILELKPLKVITDDGKYFMELGSTKFDN